MQAFLGQLDRVTLAAGVVGALTGLLWIVNLPFGLAMTGLVAAIGTMLLVLNRRWLEVGVLLAAIGIVPSFAYRLSGPPPLPDPPPLTGTPAEVLAPGGAYFFLVAGIATIVVAGYFELRHGTRRERLAAERAERRRGRVGGS
jgi:hypothetical protein